MDATPFSYLPSYIRSITVYFCHTTVLIFCSLAKDIRRILSLCCSILWFLQALPACQETPSYEEMLKSLVSFGFIIQILQYKEGKTKILEDLASVFPWILYVFFWRRWILTQVNVAYSKILVCP